MKAVYTRGALADLAEILASLESVNKLAAAAVESSISSAVARVARWPKSARAVTQWGERVRAAPLVRYPYVIFYEINADRIDILHIRHTARAPWSGPTG
jgi:plasmid stabilization system protein ParE